MVHANTDHSAFPWIELEAPRYTSYPSANHFTLSVQGETYCQWLEAIVADTPVSVYVHIPFCRELCWFCGCHTKMTYRYEPIAAYVRMLLQEISLLKRYVQGRGKLVNIHFGGGSPSLLEPGDLMAILYAIADLFGAKPEGELAIELDPRTTTPEKIELYAKLGFNRVSIGIQDFDPKVQKAVNRIQPFTLVAAVMKKLRAEGLREINCDLIYGLPYQTPQSFKATLEQLIRLDPPRVALFSYAHVPHMKKHQRLIDTATLPTEMEKLELYLLARQMLEEQGYVAIGIDHFAKPKDALAQAAHQHTLRRNFQGYVTDNTEVLIGVGASAISQFPQGYAQNSANGLQYRAQIEAGQLPTIRGFCLAGEDRMRKEIIDTLMCSMEVDLDAVALRYALPVDYFAGELMELTKTAYRDIVSLDARSVKVQPPYRMAARAVAAVFDRHRTAASGRHTKIA